MHFSILAAAGLVSLAQAQYTKVEDFFEGNFFDHFTFFTGADPTNGYVNYVDGNTANQNQYTQITDQGWAYIGVDHTTNGVGNAGRNSVRLSSNKAYTYMLAILDLNHMPGGVMGTWPAFWSYGPNWPANGEIDIIEGVNDQSMNYMTIHTGSSCTLTAAGKGLLQPFSTDCNANDNANEGCSFHDNDSNSYGTGFNNNGGGIFAMEWTEDGVSIWRWWHGNQPSDVLTDSPNPSGWGAPSANWASSSSECNWAQSLSQHNLIFDTTFCGSWGGQVYPGGDGACNDYVSNNAGDFKEAYWGLSSLKGFQQGPSSNANSGASPAPSPAASPIASPVASPAASSPAAAPPSPSPIASPSAPAAAPPAASPTPLTCQDYDLCPDQDGNGTSGNAPAPQQSPQPLSSDEFGAGSPGIPESADQPGRRAADMRMGERRRRRHLSSHIKRSKA